MRGRVPIRSPDPRRHGTARLLEYNADTPTPAIETALARWFWLETVHPGADQFSSLHEALLDGFRALAPRMGGRDLHFAAFRDAPEERLDPLLQQVIPDIPGKTLTAVQVVFPPGARSTPNRHCSAFLYAYVLAGEIRSQVEGQPSRVFRRGESWTEKPGSLHLLTENVSRTAPARLLVVFVANTGESLKTDDRVEERPDVPARAGMRFGHGDQRIAAWAHSLQEVDSCSFGAGSERLEHVCDDLHGRKVG